MKWFSVDVDLKPEDVKWAFNIGNNITEPNWTIRPYKLNDEEMERISYLTDQIGITPSYAAIIMVPANTACKTHIDDIAEKNGIAQRISAINIPIQVHPESKFQYMEDEIPVESLDLNSPKCWRVDIPHRVDHTLCNTNRVVLSLSFVEKVAEIHQAYLSHRSKIRTA